MLLALAFIPLVSPGTAGVWGWGAREVVRVLALPTL